MTMLLKGVVLALTGVAALAFAKPVAEPAAKIGAAAPAFMATGADGKMYDLKSYSGKFVVLEWTNKDCPFVKKHYGSGNMQATQEKAKEMGAVWLSVNSSAPGHEGYQDAQGLLDNMKAVGSKAVTVLQDGDGKLGHLYGARTTPQIAIIDPKGVLIYSGAIDDKPTPDPADIKTAHNYVLTALEEAMAGKPVTTPTSRPYGCSVKYGS